MSIEESRQNLRWGLTGMGGRWGLAGVGWDEEGLINLFEQLRTKLFSWESYKSNLYESIYGLY